MWPLIVGLVALVAIAYSIMPKPQSQKPPGINDVNVPTAEDGREFPVFGGTVILEAPDSAWYGDYQAVAIKKKGGKK